MPAAAIIVPFLGVSGALTTIGASIAGIAGLSVAGAGVAASIAAGTISAAAATAIGAGAISAGLTAIQGGDADDILKSAVLGGVSSYAGSAIANSVASSVTESILSSGSESLVSQSVAEAMGRVAGQAVSSGITSGTSALLQGGDPVEALIKGGISGALSGTVAESVNYALKDVPGFGKPANAFEAASQRAVKAAIGTAILTGGDQERVSQSLVNSYLMSMATGAGRQFNDSSSEVRQANDKYKSSLSSLEENMAQQQTLVDQYNNKIAPLQSKYAVIQDLSNQYDDLANKYNNYDSYMTSQGYTLIGGGYDWDGNYEGDFYAKQVWVPARQAGGYDDNGLYVTWEIPGGYQWQRAGANTATEKQLIYDQQWPSTVGLRERLPTLKIYKRKYLVER